VAIARALVNNPPIIMADEPTGNLDSRSDAEVMDILHRLHRERGITIVMVTHDDEIGAQAERIARLRDGRVVDEIDPFQLFRLNFTLWIGLSSAAVLIASLFVYRPWCQFLCPFGLLSWLVEQVSLFRPRINREACKECKLCVKACPTQAMADLYDRKKVHADCFACGDCIAACPQEEALGWWTKSQAKGKQV